MRSRKTSIKERFHILPFRNPSGEAVYRVAGTKPDGVRVRENFPSYAEAVGRKGELDIEAQNLKTEMVARLKPTRLTDSQIKEAEAGIATLAKVGHGTSLGAVRFYVDNYREPITKITVREAFDKFIREKEAANLRPDSIKNLRIKTLGLVNRYGDKLASEITPDILRELIFLPTRGPKSRDNYRRAMSSLFGWAETQGYTPANPAAKITPVKADRAEPEILTVEEAERLQKAAAAYKDGAVLPYTALATFAGLRPTELARLTWQEIDLKDKTITVGAKIAKMRGKRIVEMTDNLVEWLLPYSVQRPPIKGPNWRRDFDAVKEVAGFGTPTGDKPNLKPWPQDITRHTAISYKLAETQHEGQTATWAGNSPDIIMRHYKGLVKQRDAEAFWSIRPLANGEANIIPLAAAAV